MLYITFTVQKMKFSIKDFFSKCDQTRSFLRVWSHLLKKSLVENFIVFVQWLFFDVSGAFWKKIKIIIWKVM